jgi:hypothetical protein
MSGSANVQAILGNPPKPQDPLSIISGWQDYGNKLAQNKQIQASTANTEQATQNAILENQTGQQKLGQTMVQRHNQVMYGLANLPDSELPDAAQSALRDEVSTGQLDPQRAAVLQQQFQATGGDPSKIRKMITSGLVGNLAGPQALAAIQGTNSTIDNGQTVQGVRQPGVLSPQAGQLLTTGPQIPVGAPSNAQIATARTTAVDNNPTLTDGSPNPNYGQQISVPTPIPPQYMKPGAPGAAPGPAPAYSAANPPRLGQPGTPPGQVPGQLATGLPPGAATPLETSGSQYATAQTNAAGFGQRIVPLQRALALSAETPTGPGTSWLNNVQSYLTSNAQALGFTPDQVAAIGNIKVSNYQELGKYLTQAGNANPMAARSDSSLASVFSGSPNTHISQLAVQDTLKTQIALERMNQAAYASYSGPPNQYGSYAASYANKVDPRAFEVDMMTDAQKAAVRASLKTPQDRQRFQDSFAVAQGTNSFQNNAMPAQTKP